MESRKRLHITVGFLSLCVALAHTLSQAADITFYSFGDSHYGAPGETNWVYRINGMTNMTYPAALGGGPIAPARGVIALGDLINDAGNLSLGTNQWKAWKADYGVNGEGTCIYPVYENFGNHDLNSTRFVQKDIIQRNLSRPGLTAISTNGLHYSWDWDGVHFVALGIYPADTWVPENTYGSIHDPEYALSFLKWDLENNVGDSGRPVITMHHYDFLNGWWPGYQELDYSRALDGYNVVLILHGHQGAPYGYDWQGYTVSGENGTLNVCHITTNNQIQLVQNTGTNTWGNTYTKSFAFPDLGLSWNGLPKNKDRNVPTNVVQLAWRTGAYVQSQDVYFGTSSNEVFNSTTPAYSGLAANVTNVAMPAAYLPLQPGTEYFWRVDQQNGAKPFSKGRVWSFRTKDVPKTNDLTFLFVSDIHYQENTLLANQRNVQAMNRIPGTAYPAAIGGSVQTPRAVVFGGDAASDAKLWEWRLYTNDYGISAEKLLQYPIAGENNGNHDGGLGSIVGDGIVARNRTRSGLTGISTNGLQISWDMDGIHFVTLGVRPGTNANPYNSYGSLEFLADDLPKTVGNSGRPVVLFEHFGLDDYAKSWWTQEEWTRYYNVIKDYNVIGIFHGHTHTTEIYKWNNLDIFHPPHTQMSGSYSQTVASSNGFFAVHIVSNTMSVVERKPDATWGMSLTKSFYRSYAESGLAAIVTDGSDASNITATTASLNGKLLYQATAPTDGYIYYGTSDGGTNQSAWANVVAVGAIGLGGFKTDVAGLTAATTYYYRCYASNALGSAWSDVGSSFVTLAAAQIDNASGATGVRMTTATLNGTLTMTGAVPTEVYIYYGPTDGGSTKASWANVLTLGPRALGAFSQAISGLSMETTYYYRCYASNAVGSVWSAATSSFITQPPVMVDNGPGATAVRDTAATLNGTLLVTNAVPTSVAIYWGPTDGGTSPSSWANVIDLGTRPLGAFSSSISGLTAQARYYYRCYGSNQFGGRWATATTSFDTSRDFGAWQKKLKITFKGYNRTEPLLNIPLLVVLNNQLTNFSYADFASSKGADLMFGDANNAELKYEVEKWNPNGNSYIWVQVPRLESGTNYIWAYYGNPACTNPPAYTTNGGVWTEGYAGVWHMAQPNCLDSTSNHFNGTAAAGTNPPHTTVAGNVGDAVNCPGNGSYISVGDIDVQTNLTLEAYYYTATNAVVSKYAINKANSYRMNQENVDWLWFHVWGSNWYNNFQLNKGSLWQDKWHYAVMTYASDNGIQSTYVDGSLWGAYTNGFNPITLNSTAVRLAENYTGIFDEVRISRVCRSSNWQWACWMTLASNSAFSSYSSVTSQVVSISVNNGTGASSITPTGATLNGTLSSDGGLPCSAWFYWGTTDGGTNRGGWANHVALGPTPTGTFSTVLSNLSADTTYYYRAFASNATAWAWAPATAAFTTPGVKPLIANTPASAVSVNSATLNGQLLSTGAAPVSVWVYWGTSDGAALKANWQSTVALGPKSVGALSTAISGLAPATRYYYRFLGSNAYGESWAAATESFMTAGAGGTAGTWYWDKGGDTTNWWNAGNWSNITTHADNDGYPNGPGTVATNLNGTVVLQPNDITVGEIYGGFQLGYDVSPANTLNLDNNDAPAVWRVTTTGGGNVYNNVNLLSDLYITNTTSTTLQVYRRNVTGPGKEIHVTTLGSGGVTFAMEDPATSYNTFSNLYVHANSLFTIRETARTPARTPLGTGKVFLEPGSTLAVILRVWATNDIQLLGNVKMTYTDDRAQGVQLDGVISGAGQLTFQHNDTSAAAGNFFLGGSQPNTYSGGTVVIGDNTANAYGTLVLRKNGAAGTGDVILTNEYAKLQITDGGTTDDRINDGAALRLYHVGTAYAKVTLDSGVNETLGGLFFDGVAQPAGTYGSSTSAAANKNDNWFSGAGILTVVPNPDIDNDGIPDVWEMATFGNLTTANATSDFDHDGQSDLNEYRAGTNPTDNGSVFTFTESSYSSQAGAVVLKWQSVDGKFYTLEQTTNLTGGNWQVVVTNLAATPPLNTYTSTPSAFGSVFYRVSTH